MSGKYAQGRSLSVWRARYETSLLSSLIFFLFTMEVIGYSTMDLWCFGNRPQGNCSAKGDAIFIIFSKEENHESKFPWFSNHLHAKHLQSSKWLLNNKCQ